MKKSLIRWLEDAWYKEMYLSTWIMPFSMFYVDAVRLRRFMYRTGLKKTTKLPVPVIVVGNITVGGTGKTPLVIWLVEYLRTQGYNPGVISRGYAGEASLITQDVSADSTPQQVGDEAIVIFNRCQCPVTVGADRVSAGRKLLSQHPCDVLISDDGLQHYALQRDVEIVVIDGQRRFGNGYCLPAGPLREPIDRIRQVDLLVVNNPVEPQEAEFPMYYQGDEWINLQTGERKTSEEFKNTRCHAIAGVGNPARFFSQLAAAGLECDTLAFPDHHAFKAEDITFKDSKPVLMTEKDAVKCRHFATARHWYLPVTAQLPAEFSQKLLKLLKEKHHG